MDIKNKTGVVIDEDVEGYVYAQHSTDCHINGDVGWFVIAEHSTNLQINGGVHWAVIAQHSTSLQLGHNFKLKRQLLIDEELFKLILK